MKDPNGAFRIELKEVNKKIQVRISIVLIECRTFLF